MHGLAETSRAVYEIRMISAVTDHDAITVADSAGGLVLGSYELLCSRVADPEKVQTMSRVPNIRLRAPI